MSAVTRYFEHLLAEHGDSPRALDWSAEGQVRRFDVLTQIGISTRGSVLDVGCGLGHFLAYLRDNEWGGFYCGIDASEDMIAAARKKHDYAVSHFRVGDALRDPLPPADYVVASGVLNVEQGDNANAMRTLIQNCHSAARIGAAINMLSTRAPTKHADRHYYDPALILDFAIGVSPRVTLRHDYKDNDFTVYLFKERA